jgi:hypothetical protein
MQAAPQNISTFGRAPPMGVGVPVKDFFKEGSFNPGAVSGFNLPNASSQALFFLLVNKSLKSPGVLLLAGRTSSLLNSDQ